MIHKAQSCKKGTSIILWYDNKAVLLSMKSLWVCPYFPEDASSANKGSQHHTAVESWYGITTQPLQRFSPSGLKRKSHWVWAFATLLSESRVPKADKELLWQQFPPVYDCTRAVPCDSHPELCFTGVLKEAGLVAVTPPEVTSIKCTDTSHCILCLVQCSNPWPAWPGFSSTSATQRLTGNHTSSAHFSQLHVKETILNPARSFRIWYILFLTLKHLKTTNSTWLKQRQEKVTPTSQTVLPIPTVHFMHFFLQNCSQWLTH